MTVKTKAPATSPQEPRCGGCGETTDQSVDRARAAGWRIPWTPGEASWCPDCWNPSRKREPAWRPMPYDEPLFGDATDAA